MCSQYDLTDERTPTSLLTCVLDEICQDDEAAIGPTTTLNDQRAKIGRRRAVGEPLWMIVKCPATSHQINGRAGVLDHRAVLYEYRDCIATFFYVLTNIA